MKKFLSILLTLFLIFTLIITSFANETFLLRDEIPLLTEEDIEPSGLYSLGVLKGTGNGLELGKTLTRAEAVCLILRLHPQNPGVLGLPSPEFSDMDGHWAYKEVTTAKKMGLVNGTSATTFEPDRLVSGKEFTKILLSMLGYKDVTIENSYEMGKEANVLVNNFTKSVVYNNEKLLRSDAARLCYASLLAKTSGDELLYRELINKGRFEKEKLEQILIVNDAISS